MTYNVAQDGTATKDTSKTYTLTGTRTQAQKDLYDINLHEMTWAEISALADNTITATQSPFYDAMLCGDTKSVRLDLNNTLKLGTYVNQWGDGGGTIYTAISNGLSGTEGYDDPRNIWIQWNPSGYNGAGYGGYSTSHIRATLVGSSVNTTYAGSTNLTTSNSLYTCIESGLRNIITAKKVRYATHTSPTNTTVKSNTLTDKIWLFSEKEVKGTGEFSGNNIEGLTKSFALSGSAGLSYDRFNFSESRYRISSANNGSAAARIALHDGTSAIIAWWLRSIGVGASSASDRIIRRIDSSGIGNAYGQTTAKGISFGFCITKRS